MWAKSSCPWQLCYKGLKKVASQPIMAAETAYRDTQASGCGVQGTGEHGLAFGAEGDGDDLLLEQYNKRIMKPHPKNAFAAKCRRRSHSAVLAMSTEQQRNDSLLLIGLATGSIGGIADSGGGLIFSGFGRPLQTAALHLFLAGF